MQSMHGNKLKQKRVMFQTIIGPLFFAFYIPRVITQLFNSIDKA